MRRREVISLFASAIACASARPFGVRAQARNIDRIGVLETIPLDRNKANFAALLRGLREHGYIEGQNLQIEYRSADGDADRFPALVAELIGRGIDLIVTRGTPAAKSAKAATATIPIVMAAIGEPLGVDVVASLAQPGGNVTGFSAFVTELSGKRVELLKETFPSIARVGLLQNMGNPVSPPHWEATLSAAKTLGLSAEVFDVRGDRDIASAFAVMRQRRVTRRCYAGQCRDDRQACGGTETTNRVPGPRVRRGGRALELRRGLSGSLLSRRRARRQDLQGGAAR